jgi:PAS domain S-box-containing protein
LSSLQRSRKPTKQKRYRSLSDPKTLNELALRLKEGIYITTFDGEIIDANPAFLEMIGVDSLENLKGYHTRDFAKPEVREREMALLEREGVVRRCGVPARAPRRGTRTVVDSAFLSVDPRSAEKFCRGILVDTMVRADRRLLAVRVDERRHLQKRRKKRPKRS